MTKDPVLLAIGFKHRVLGPILGYSFKNSLMGEVAAIARVMTEADAVWVRASDIAVGLEACLCLVWFGLSPTELRAP